MNKCERCQFCSIFNPRTEKQVCDDWALVNNPKREMYCENALNRMLEFAKTKSQQRNTQTINHNINKQYTKKQYTKRGSN